MAVDVFASSVPRRCCRRCVNSRSRLDGTNGRGGRNQLQRLKIGSDGAYHMVSSSWRTRGFPFACGCGCGWT